MSNGIRGLDGHNLVTPNAPDPEAAHDSRAAEILKDGLADLLYSDPLRVLTAAACECDTDGKDDEALALIKEALPLALAKLAKRARGWHRLRQPRYLAPLKDGTWIALNAECTPLGYADIRPYDPLPYFAHLTWRFPAGFDPRSMKGVWRPWSIGGGFRNDDSGLWLSFTRRDYGAGVGRVVAETTDPLRSVEMLLGDKTSDPPDTVLATWREERPAA
jgi:hypothetical protein